MNDFQKLKNKGIIFDSAKHFITEKNRAQLAQDTALTTPANSGIPGIFTNYLDSKIIDILLAPRNARQIFPETKKGDWTTDYAVFRTVEPVGSVTPYTDYGNGASADTNVAYPTRQQYVGQTTIKYGDLEQERSARAMIDLVSQKQTAAATVIDIAANKIDLLGIEGMSIYGLINEPNIPAALTPESVGGKTAWSDKSTKDIYNDILKLFKQIITASKGLINQTDAFVLAVAPGTAVELGKATDYNVSVWDMVKKYAPNVDIVTLPELASATSGDAVMLIAKQVQGLPTAELGYSEKMRAMRLIPHSSYYEQKFAFGSYGAILYRPFAIAKMTGVSST